MAVTREQTMLDDVGKGRLARWALWISCGSITATLVLGALMELGVGIEAMPMGDDFAERVVNRFLEAEQAWQWQRWIEPLTAIAFASLLIAVSALPKAARAKTTLVSGLTILVSGELIDIGQEAAIKNARLTLDAGASDSFAAFNVARFVLDDIAVWFSLGGGILLAVGVLLLTIETAGPWRYAGFAFSASLVFVGVAPFTDSLYPWAYTFFTASMVWWTLTAARHVTPTESA